MQQNILRDRIGAAEGHPVEAYGPSRDLNVSVIPRPSAVMGYVAMGLAHVTPPGGSATQMSRLLKRLRGRKRAGGRFGGTASRSA
jgi:hypothetical protein